VIGGGVMNRELLYDRIRHHCFKALNGYIKHPKLATEKALKTFIVKSRYENNLGLIASTIVGANSQSSLRDIMVTKGLNTVKSKNHALTTTTTSSSKTPRAITKKGDDQSGMVKCCSVF
jgi:hypothetical protein